VSEFNQAPRVPWGWIGPLLAFIGSAFAFVAWRAVAYPGGTQGAGTSPWYAVALFEVCWLTLGGVLIWGGLRQALTKLTASGVSQLSLRGWVTLQWSDVTDVREVAGGRVLEVRGGGKVIRISPLFYAHADDTSEWLSKRLPTSVRSRLTSA
jgi:hypothetical protein